jgi:uncharacterized protein DUF6958
MPSTKTVNKVQMTNPNTGSKMNIDADTWILFNRAITDVLSGGKELTFTEITTGVKKFITKNKIPFKKSISWYAVSVKLDMETRGMIEAFTEKGKKLHRLKKKK